MRYGNPAVRRARWTSCAAAGCDRILVVPLYPQYAASTTASAMDAVYAHCAGMRRMPAMRVDRLLPRRSGVHRGARRGINDHWMKHGRPDRLVLSFHGLPRRVLELGDPYHCHCQKTARLLADGAGARSDAVRGHVPVALRQGGVAEALHRRSAGRRSRAKAPGASTSSARGSWPTASRRWRRSASRGRRTFLAAGGKDFHLIPCLNEDPRWIAALTGIILRNLQGWLVAPPDARGPRRDAGAGRRWAPRRNPAGGDPGGAGLKRRIAAPLSEGNCRYPHATARIRSIDDPPRRSPERRRRPPTTRCPRASAEAAAPDGRRPRPRRPTRRRTSPRC